MKTLISRCLLLLGLIALPALPALGQGVTSSSIAGTVVDASGLPMPGANVVVVHEPTGSQYGTTTRSNGEYRLVNLRPGGPYSISASFVGYLTARETEIQLQLGQTRQLDFVLEEATAELDEIEVVGTTSSVLNSQRTGASHNIDEDAIERMPTISRSITDFARLTPQSTGGSSLAGRNNRYNNIQVDGATLNDVFGLTGSGLPTGQTGAQPLSLDAIQEFNVDIAPYDVRYSGFTGGSINAVTKSGTNEFTGSLRYLGRNQSFVGGGPAEADYPEFSEQFFVGTLGGPIVRNRAFFFANVEYETENAPIDAGITGSGATNIFPIAPETLDRLRSIAQGYGYDPGEYGLLNNQRKNLKILAKIDWNIDNLNRLTLRNSFVQGSMDDGINRNSSDFDLSNRRFVRDNTTNSIVAELRSTFSPTMFNEARLVYTRVRDARNVEAEAFPYVMVQVGDRERAYLGIDRFSQANALNQDLWELTNNLTILSGDHNITLGTSNQLFSFGNLFIQDYYGGYDFASLDDFEAGNPSRYYLSYSLLDDPEPWAEFTAVQFGLYAQDEWQVTPTLNLTLGLRADIPFFPEDPLYNPAAEDAFNVGTDEVPTGNIMWSPRLGFNWDASGGERTTQIRGGTGIFSGRTPFVWISNQFSNTGMDFARVDVNDPGFFIPSADPADQLAAARELPTGQTSEINITATDFRFPQVWRTNLAIDQSLPFFDLVGTVEALYSKSVNDITFENLNLVQTGETAYGRPIYGGRLDDRFTNAILMKNTSEGYETSITASLQRQVRGGLNGLLAYTFNRAENINNGGSSRAISNWQYNPSMDINDPRTGTSSFEVRHRILASTSYRFDWMDRFATTVGLFFESRSGEPYSWIYNGNANGDTRFDNDLVFVPATADQIELSTNNWAELDAFISDHSDLDDARGSVITRNSARAPWRNTLDLNVTQQVMTTPGQRFEITANLLNVLNLLNKDWGVIEFAPNNNRFLFDFEGYTDDGRPIIGFREPQALQTSSLVSRWQLQLGVRYVF